MTPKEKAIRNFAKAMRSASVEYYASRFADMKIHLTLNMQLAWDDFIVGCIEEVRNGRSKK